MKFSNRVPLSVGVFYSKRVESKLSFLLPIRHVPITESLFAKEFLPTSKITSNFEIFSVGVGGRVEDSDSAVAFLFQSKLPVVNYGTGIMSYSRAWQETSNLVSVCPSEVFLLHKNPEFYLYKATDLVTIVTRPELNESIDSYLTMI